MSDNIDRSLFGDDLFGSQIIPEYRGKAGALAKAFVMPPFTVLDARSGAWQERKRAWISLGIRSELGRGDVMPSGKNSIYSGESDWAGDRGPNKLPTCTAAPGGSLMPAMNAKRVDGSFQRGDGAGRPLDEPRAHDHDETQVDLFADTAHLAPPPDSDARFGTTDNHTSRQPGDLTFSIGCHPYLPHAVTYQGQDRLNEIMGTEVGKTGTSIFDPVLCELMYRWFCPPSGWVLDPFAGGSVRGIVAAILGRHYVGVDLSERQCQANADQAELLLTTLDGDGKPEWVVGDSTQVDQLATGLYDFVFSCPPYGDLERYSEDPTDISTMSHEQFLLAYQTIICAAVRLLKPNRFAAFVVGDFRDRQGFYRNFPGRTVEAFVAAGARYYNEAVLLTSVGSLPIRVSAQFPAGRKLGKGHQNVLVFCKGDPKKAAQACQGPDKVGPKESDSLIELHEKDTVSNNDET